MGQRNGKRLQPMTIAVSTEHIEALDEVISFDPMFPPSRSEITALAIYYLRDSIRRGETSLLDVYQTYIASDVSDARKASNV